jgi:hypothetical protein
MNLEQIVEGNIFTTVLDGTPITSTVDLSKCQDPELGERLVLAVQLLQAACHNAAKHWWIDPKTGVDIRTNPMAFAQKLCLIHSEISESMEGDRKSLPDNKLPHRPMREVELADAMIRIGDTGGGYKLDLAGALVEKMAFNAYRPDHKIENRIAEGGKAY